MRAKLRSPCTIELEPVGSEDAYDVVIRVRMQGVKASKDGRFLRLARVQQKAPFVVEHDGMEIQPMIDLHIGTKLPHKKWLDYQWRRQLRSAQIQLQEDNG